LRNRLHIVFNRHPVYAMLLSWPPADLPSQLEENVVHIWAWTSIADDAQVAILSPEERERMNRFHFPKDRVHYMSCHANLRRLLSHYQGCAPSELAFVANRFGKPELIRKAGARPLRFNLSHSGDVGLLAITRSGEIGADVEVIRAIEPEVAKANFSRRELADLKKLRAGEWLIGFFNCWTRKEAILKAEGCGLNIALDAFDVTLLPHEPAALRAWRPEAGLRRNWRLETLAPGPGIAGAAAVSSRTAKMECFQFIG
jgi:4'-phosphopantetheinyl transferase